jgi:ribosomal protein S18 acetylase RimI-like enzyme
VSADIRVRPLADGDPVSRFDCGTGELNRWLRSYAFASAELDSARTHVALGAAGEICGYVALTASSVEHRQAATEMRQQMPGYPLPVVLLARLAVDRAFQRQGIASMLVRLAMEITVEIAKRIGVRGLAVDAETEEVAGFYERLGFARALPGSPKLQVPTWVLREQLQPS